LTDGSLAAEIYGTTEISERHRHRYEFNNKYRDDLCAKGLVLSGLSPDGNLVEIVEYPQNDFMIGVQFHPEFKSRPHIPHPVFKSFIAASAKHRDNK
jgi:CTP synthase